MVRFTREMRDKAILEWECFYVSYNSLKTFIKRDKSEKSILEFNFFKLLGKELDKAGFNYTSMKTAAKSTADKLEFVENPTLEDEQTAFELSKSLRNLIKFATWNFNIVCHLLQRLQKAGVENAKAKFLKSHQDEITRITYDKELSDILHILESFVTRISPQLDTNGQDIGMLNQSLLGGLAHELVVSISESLIQAKNELISFQNLMGNKTEQEYPHFLTLFLSVISSPIYFTNFYMLGLTGNEYSEYLGVSEYFNGVLVAINWIAVFACGFLYGHWSKTHYKIPISFSILMAVLGNLLYFLAYDAKSLYFLIIGRFLFGIGNPRVINRRYISLNVSTTARAS